MAQLNLLSREFLEQAYRREEDPAVKERLLLVLRVRGDGVVAAQAAREVHRTRAWASKWLKRLHTHGLDGLKDGPRGGRPPKMGLSLQVRIRRRLEEGSQGWRVKEVWSLIREESGVTLSLRQVYRLLHRWGYRTIVPKKGRRGQPPGRRRRPLKGGQGTSSTTCPRASP